MESLNKEIPNSVQEKLDRLCTRIKGLKGKKSTGGFSNGKLNGLAFSAVQGFARQGIQIFRHTTIYGVLINETVPQDAIFQGFVSTPKEFEVGSIIEHPIVTDNYRVVEKEDFTEDDFDRKKGNSEAISKILCSCEARDPFEMGRLLKMAVSAGICKLVFPLKIIYIEFDNRDFTKMDSGFPDCE